jgi:hypothetical protein
VVGAAVRDVGLLDLFVVTQQSSLHTGWLFRMWP